MSTLPALPALLAAQPQQNDPLVSIQRILAMKSLLGQQQMQGVELQRAQQGQRDEQATTKALRDWDGQNPNDLPHLILQNGGSSNAVLNAQSKLIEMRQKAATLDEATLKNEQTRNDQYRGKILSIVNAPDGQKQTLWAAEVAKERQAGTQLPPEIADQYPGDDVATQHANSFALGSTLAKEAIDSKTAGARATTAKTGADKFAAEQNPQSPLFAPTQAATNIAAQGGTPWATAAQAGAARQAGAVSSAQAQAEQPYKMQLEQIRQQVSQNAGIAKDARDKIEGTVLKPYEDKMSQISELQSAIQQAQQGNVTAARGVLLKLIGVTNPDGTKRYNEAEAQRLLQQGNIGQRFAGTVKNLLTGDQWTDGMATDMQNFAAAQGQVANQNLSRGIDNVNTLYGTSVGGGLKNPGVGGVTVTDPKGGVHTFPDQASADRFKKLAGIR